MELEPGLDGLVHISQCALKRIAKVEDAVQVGQTVRVKVLKVDKEAKRISLSRREALLEENPEIAEQIAAERAERDRQYQERQEQRAREREQQAAGNAQRQSRERSSASSDNGERRERNNDRRRRSSEDGEYELPPVQSTTTSLADLFSAFKTEE